MILVHQRKSAGSSLMRGLAADLGLEVATVRATIFNARGERLFRELRRFEPADAPVASFHLHPTRRTFEWVRGERVRAVVLLRDPRGSFDALYRHRHLDGTDAGPNVVATYAEPLAILEEFNHTWRCLADRDHLLFLSYDEVVGDYPSVLAKVARFYDRAPREGGELPKVRYSGARDRSGETPTDLSPTTGPRFEHEPDWSRKAATFLWLREHLPSPVVGALRSVRRALRT